MFRSHRKKKKGGLNARKGGRAEGNEQKREEAGGGGVVVRGRSGKGGHQDLNPCGGVANGHRKTSREFKQKREGQGFGSSVGPLSVPGDFTKRPAL